MINRHSAPIAVGRSVRLGRRIVGLLTLLLVSAVGLSTIQSTAEPLLDDEAGREERVAFRHFL